MKGRLLQIFFNMHDIINMNISSKLLLVCMLVFIASCDSAQDNTPEDDRVQTIDFILEDLDGNPFQLSSTQGKVVILNFFATTCPICQAEADDLNELYLTYQTQGVEVIGIALRTSSEEDIKTFVEAFNIPYKVLLDDTVVSRAYRVAGTPDAYFIDREGFTVERIQGFKPLDFVERLLESLL